MEILNIYTPEGRGGEKLYSVSLDNEELRLYGEYQKEFNSKAQKARRLANTMKIAGKSGIEKYKSKGFKTVENKSFLKEAREAERKLTQEEILGKGGVPRNVNQFINNKVATLFKRTKYDLAYGGSGLSNARVLSSSYTKPKRGYSERYDHFTKSVKSALAENHHHYGDFKDVLKKYNQ